MAGLSADIPELSTELKATLKTARARAAVNRINATVGTSAPPLQSFIDTGLPQYAHLARETRDLVESLKKLTAA